MNGGPLICDSVTQLDDSAAGRVVVAGSHGGIYAAYLAACAGVRAVLLNDAGVGKDNAGIGGLRYLEDLGIAAAAVGHDSARIGDGVDCANRGVVSHLNARAFALGCRVGQPVREVMAALDQGANASHREAPLQIEGRHRIDDSRGGGGDVWAIDSISLVRPEDGGAIVFSGSHGGLLGGNPETALRSSALAAVFNDAGGGIDGAGFTRLPALDVRGIPAATVDAFTARIGDGRSTYEDGVISRVNLAAAKRGAKIGMPARAMVECIAGRAQRR